VASASTVMGPVEAPKQVILETTHPALTTVGRLNNPRFNP
jgi:hypothetical protein